jgi:hypothetical protein
MPRKDDYPIHMKFGYDRMVEIEAIRKRLKGTGLNQTELYFACNKQYDENHKNDPTWQERQAAWWARQSPAKNELVEALKMIRDGTMILALLLVRFLKE